MVEMPPTRYAVTSDAVHVAYQVWGEGPDLVMVPGFISHLDMLWQSPEYAAMARRLGEFARVITLDKRGTGLSDRPTELPDADRRMQDLMAVMDAAGSHQATLFGVSEGGAMCILFAATHPERMRSLVLFGAYATTVAGPDHPDGVPVETIDAIGQTFEAQWGTGVALASFAPSMAEDPQARQWWAMVQRMSASPAAARALVSSYNLIDVRPALPLVTAPTLVLHRAGDRVVPLSLGEEVHEGIDGSRMVVYPGADHLLATTNWPDVIDEIEEFVTGRAPAVPAARQLATVLLTDIVDSTSHARSVGDARWQATLDAHDDIARREIERHGGRFVHGTGDGLLATFDGPTRAIGAATQIARGSRTIGVRIRAGLHTGEIVERPDGDIAGLAVHVASRIAAEAGPDEILVSRTTTDLVVGSGLSFEDVGQRSLKGLETPQHLFRVAGRGAPRPEPSLAS